MKNTFLLAVVLFSVVLLSGCPQPPDDGSNLYKGVLGAVIPAECAEFKDDVCGLYDCMVDRCWCDEGYFPGPILLEGNTVVANEQQAMQVVGDYLAKGEVKSAVELNPIFYNVFYDVEGDEEYYTVAVDGTILKTICGV